MAPRLSLFLATWALARAARLWYRSEVPTEKAGGTSSNGEIICGDYQIWSKLTASSSPFAVKNIRWGKITSIAQDFLSDRRTEKDGLEAEIQRLQERIAEKELSEKPKLTTRDELEQLIKGSLVSFQDPEHAEPTSAESASRTKCGKPFSRPRAPKGAYQASKKAFMENADAFFDEHKRLDRDLFHAVCKELLPPGEDSYCGALCQYFHDTAKGFSNERAGEAGGLKSDDLIKTMLAQKQRLKAVTGDIESCEKATERIALFRSEVEELKKAGDKCADELEDAEWALDDAQYKLEDLTERLGQQELALAAAEEALVGDDAKVTQAKDDIKETEAQGASLKAQLVAAQAELEGLQQDLLAAGEATQVSFDLKLALEAVMKKMTDFFDEAALEPLRFMGLDEDCKPSTYFNSPEKQEAEKEAFERLGEGVGSLAAYCETTAKPAFAAVADAVDLTPLCEIGEPEAITEETLKVVKDKEKMFVDELTDILDWLNPYRGNGMTQEKASERVKNGELKGFQEVISVYSGTKFFKQYLKKWRKGGEISELLGGLAKLIEQLKEAKEKAELEIGKLETALAAVGPQLAKLAGDLEAAEAAKAVSQEKQGELSAAVQGIQQEAAQTNDLIAELLERVRKAKLACEKVDQDLQAALQTLKSKRAQQEAALLEMMRMTRHLAGQRLARARHLVASSERSLLSAQAAAVAER